LNRQVWEDIHNLPWTSIRPWDGLLLDVNAELPNAGPAIVLAATALEVFISHNLDRLAEKTSIPTELWKWINERSNRIAEPTLEEQYDVLLKFFSGHSLKDEQKLRESLRIQDDAKNNFVHGDRKTWRQTGYHRDDSTAYLGGIRDCFKGEGMAS
jgi:hypothetical protein